ncbi:hypothetical protein Y032_0428g1281 [Ancylostoma ceylanicum]|nr:hypothetical protein Y032_0428g1281 [Ancylostoma ceylanicum]
MICEDAQRLASSVEVEYVMQTNRTNYCVGDEAAECVPPIFQYRQNYRVASKYHLAGCVIEKNFSTMLTAILCYLFDEARFTEHNRNITAEVYHKRFCKAQNEHDSLASLRSELNVDLKGWSLIAVVRDPLERFVSGYANKCLRERVWKKFPDRCHGCKTNLTCFMERQYMRMKRWARSTHFIASFDDNHFFPQNWRCEFSSHLHDYQILKFDTFNPQGFIDRLLAIFKKHKVSEKSINFIRTSVTSRRTAHSTKDSVEQRETKNAILSSKHLTNILIKMYFYDFVLFGFPIPEATYDE